MALLDDRIVDAEPDHRGVRVNAMVVRRNAIGCPGSLAMVTTVNVPSVPSPFVRRRLWAECVGVASELPA